MLYAAFYKATKGNLIDKLIGLRTWSRFSHCEFMFGKDGIAFGSSPREQGTRFKWINFFDGKWSLVALPWVNESVARDFCHQEVGKPYDWSGVLSFCLPWVKPNDSKWFCSEIMSMAIRAQGFELPKPPHKMSPEGLWEYLEDETVQWFGGHDNLKVFSVNPPMRVEPVKIK